MSKENQDQSSLIKLNTRNRLSDEIEEDIFPKLNAENDKLKVSGEFDHRDSKSKGNKTTNLKISNTRVIGISERIEKLSKQNSLKDKDNENSKMNSGTSLSQVVSYKVKDSKKSIVPKLALNYLDPLKRSTESVFTNITNIVINQVDMHNKLSSRREKVDYTKNNNTEVSNKYNISELKSKKNREKEDIIGTSNVNTKSHQRASMDNFVIDTFKTSLRQSKDKSSKDLINARASGNNINFNNNPTNTNNANNGDKLVQLSVLSQRKKIGNINNNTAAVLTTTKKTLSPFNDKSQQQEIDISDAEESILVEDSKLQNSKQDGANEKKNVAINIFKNMAENAFGKMLESKEDSGNKENRIKKNNSSISEENGLKDVLIKNRENSAEDDKLQEKENEKQEIEDLKKHNVGKDIVMAEGNMFVNNNIKDISHQIFWTKKEIKDFQSKVRRAGEKIREKQKKDFEELFYYIALQDGNEVLKIIKNEDFKAFYKLELKKPFLLEEIFLHQMPEIVVELVTFDSNIFAFSKNFVFTYIERNIKKKELYLENEELTQLNFLNIIKFQLYDKKHAGLLLWFYAHFNYLEAFLLIIEQNPNTDFGTNRLIVDELELETYAENKENYTDAIKNCLNYGFEDLAIGLIFYFKVVNDESIIETAVKNGNLRYLQVIWEKYNEQNVSHDNLFITSAKSGGSNFDDESIFSQSIKKNISTVSSKSNRSSNRFSNRQSEVSSKNNRSKKTIINADVSVMSSKLKIDECPFNISDLVHKLHKIDKQSQIYEIITSWKYVENDKRLVETLFKKACFDEIGYLIWKNKVKNSDFTVEHFKVVINSDQLELIPFFLGFQACKDMLKDKQVQKEIVEKYFKFGNKLYYGAIMLSFLDYVSWDNNLTKELCRLIIYLIKKSRDIMNCHSPIISSLLLCEFLKAIAEVSVEHSSRCFKVIEELFLFIKNIQEANPSEIYIKFLMQQKDMKGRNSFHIAAQNNFFSVLESPELGTIVKKMWNGKLSVNNFMGMSAVNNFVENTIKENKLFNAFPAVENQKYYNHQLQVWTDSCSQRYSPEGPSTIILILVYNLFIYYLVSDTHVINEERPNENSIMIDVDKQSFKTMFLFYVYLLFVILINLSNINYIIYVKKIKKNINYGSMFKFEFLLLLLSLSIYIDPERYGYTYSDDNMKSSEQFAVLLRVTILSICDFIVWMRITTIMLTWRTIGPLIHMIFLLLKIMLYYVFILALYMATFATVYTIVFYKYSVQFNTFTNTITTLFSGFINNMDCFGFDKDWQTVGGFAIMLFVTLSGMLIINLMIAFLSNFYRKISNVVDSTHRSVLINYHRRYKWDNFHGWMLYLVPPLNIVNYIVLFIRLFSKKDTKSMLAFNMRVCKIYHTVFYLPIMLSVFFFQSFLLMFVAYFKGIIIAMFSGSGVLEYSFLDALLSTIKWLTGGLPYMFWIVVRDCKNFCVKSFEIYEARQSEMMRIKKFITEENVVVFLKFIHSRKKTESNELHNIFLDYLNYENKIITEKDAKLKEKSKYLTKIQHAGTAKKKKKGRTNPTFLLSTQTKEEGNSVTNSYAKKNLIIIEILENFLIDDGTESNVVDVEKLKMLLPKTTKIDNDYLKRLVFTDIQSVNKAINKLKTKKNVFLQNALLRKICASVSLVDAEMDEKDCAVVDDDHNTSDKLRKKESLKKFLQGQKTDDVAEFDFYSDLNNISSRIVEDLTEVIRLRKIADSGNKKKHHETDTKNHNSGDDKDFPSDQSPDNRESNDNKDSNNENNKKEENDDNEEEQRSSNSEREKENNNVDNEQVRKTFMEYELNKGNNKLKNDEERRKPKSHTEVLIHNNVNDIKGIKEVKEYSNSSLGLEIAEDKGENNNPESLNLNSNDNNNPQHILDNFVDKEIKDEEKYNELKINLNYNNNNNNSNINNSSQVFNRSAKYSVLD